MTANASRTGVSTMNSPAKSRTGLARRLFRWVFWFCLSLPLLGVLGVLLYSYVLDYAGSRELNAALAEAKKRGVPVDFEDPFFSKWQEAAALGPASFDSLTYMTAFALIRNCPDVNRASPLPLIGQGRLPADPREALPADTLAAARECLAGTGGIVSLLDQASRVPDVHFPVDWAGMATIVYHAFSARQAARLLMLKACVDAEDGKVQDAIKSVSCAMALSKPIKHEPALVSAVIATWMEASVLDEVLPRILFRCTPANADLEPLQETLQRAADSSSMRNALCGEVPCEREACEKTLKGELEEYLAPYDIRPVPRPGLAKPFYAIGRWFARGTVKSSYARQVRLLLRLIDEADRPATPLLVSSAEREKAIRSIQSPFYVNRWPADFSFFSAIQEFEKTRAKLRAAAACVAALRCRNDNGKWPESLETLVPRYMKEVPIDPFTGKPLVYQVTADGLMAYSIGPNLTDDGGKPRLVPRPKDVDETEWTRRFDDAGFRLYR